MLVLKIVLIMLAFAAGFVFTPSYLDFTAAGTWLRLTFARLRAGPVRVLEPIVALLACIPLGVWVAHLLEAGGTPSLIAAFVIEFAVAVLAGAALTPAPSSLRLDRRTWTWHPQWLAFGTAVFLLGSTVSYVAEAQPSTPAPAAAARLTLTIETGKMIGRPGWPTYLADGGSSARIEVPAHAVVTVVLKSFDNGTAPPPAAYARVEGTVGDVVQVDGRTVDAFAPTAIAHTFTVSGLGLNVPVPAVTGGAATVTETFQFRTGAPGTYTWQCYAPCGTGPSGWGGPMVTPGYMTGIFDVVAAG